MKEYKKYRGTSLTSMEIHWELIDIIKGVSTSRQTNNQTERYSTNVRLFERIGCMLNS